MEVGVLKSELAALDSKERREMIALDNQAYRKELARRIDDKDPNHWVSLDELERRLGWAGLPSNGLSTSGRMDGR